MRVQQTAVYTTGAFGKGCTLLTITQLETHQVHSTSSFEFARSTRVSAKAGLWTLDWTVDWTLDCILDWILDSIIHGPEGIQKTKLVHNKYNTHT